MIGRGGEEQVVFSDESLKQSQKGVMSAKVTQGGEGAGQVALQGLEWTAVAELVLVNSDDR